MKKKLFIGLSIGFGVVITIIVLVFTVFTVKDVSLDFRTSLENNYDQQEIIENSQIPFGRNILFLKTEDLKNNIEKINKAIK